MARGGKWLVFQAPTEYGVHYVTIVEGIPMGASPRDYMTQLAQLLDNTEEFPVVYVQVLQGNFSEGLLEVFDHTGSRINFGKVTLG